MKINRLRLAILALATIAALFVGTNQASAQSVSVRIGTPPPPPPSVVYRPWAPPYRGAVWIAGHHEWVNGAWVWVGGYYAYPPRPGGVWISARWRHGYYYPGHWRY